MPGGRRRKGSITTREERHSFFLNPYLNVAFTRCPGCRSKTKVRKFFLLVHVEPRHLLCLNKTCRYCTGCDLIIARKAELEQFLYAVWLQRAPEIVGNDYLVFGTLDRRDWQRGQREELGVREAISLASPFKEMLHFEPAPPI
ncbi:MAG TPA: hypothetical protein VFA32_16565 [Dehalococcoidia bacterium]|jgi:hypothetical protein|nr:hypothetical protein [Dehalococcoidia bacterium]